jgi:hypothetical protein
MLYLLGSTVAPPGQYASKKREKQNPVRREYFWIQNIPMRSPKKMDGMCRPFFKCIQLPQGQQKLQGEVHVVLDWVH